jgi:hypothetical protein
MATTFERAFAHFITTCPYITAVHDLLTKQRVELMDGYCLDCFFNATLGKYGYTLIHNGKRVVGWDNAPHHPGLPNFPHHIHYADGRIEASLLNGDPAHDLAVVQSTLEEFLR